AGPGQRAPDRSDLRRVARDGLAHLHDLGYLRDHPLAGLAAVAAGLDAAERGQALRRRLLTAVDELRGPPDAAAPAHVRRRHELLRLRYVEALDVERVRRALAISRSLYFREHGQALDAVAARLNGLFDLAARDGRAPRERVAPLLAPPGERGGSRGNLPAQLTSFVGREEELAVVADLVRANRLVTLTGTGGCGKTRLAIQAAGSLAGAFPAGAWFVDLAPAGDEASVPRALAGALGMVALREAPGLSSVDALVEALGGEPRLLLFDNCEHLVDACARLAEDLLRGCPRLTVLATSRELLGARGEVAWRVPSLGVPPAADPVAPATAEQFAAVRLFRERAQAARPDFALTDANTDAVARICRRLDGIPLALELAAARTRVLSVEQIAERLDDLFQLLAGGARTALHRQQTLRATLDWSHGLLSAQERALLRRLAVFAGGFTLEAAEGVCAGAFGVESTSPEARTVLDVLVALADKSLVVADGLDAAVRYRLLETVRQYAAEKLAEAGEIADARERHLVWFLALAEQGEPGLRGPDASAWEQRFVADHDNLLAALDWAIAQRDGDRAVRLAAALGFFWMERDHLIDAARLIAAIEVHQTEAAPTPALARTLAWATHISFRRAETDTARALAEGCLASSGVIGDPLAVLIARRVLSLSAQHRADGAPDVPADEALTTMGSADDRWATAFALRTRGIELHFQGHTETARGVFDEGLALARLIGSRSLVAWCLEFLGVCAYFLGDLDEVERRFHESLDVFRALGASVGIARVLRDLARVALARGDLDQAFDLLRESIDRHRRVGWMLSIVYTLETVAGHAAL
ncbi:MAG TPA: tetratricopeptide repeat protein, partial [Planctomycetota bacterium]|nr:tetratricopeptide repeat protein [Planctomycetota bacterium]